MPTRSVSASGLQFIKRMEGCKLSAYLCEGKRWTIGYGSTAGVREGMTITQETAERLLAADVQRHANAVTYAVKVPLAQHEFDALVSLCFNIGHRAFSNSTLLRLLNAGLKSEAAAQFEVWRLAGGKVSPGLVWRRRLERDIFERGHGHSPLKPPPPSVA